MLSFDNLVAGSVVGGLSLSSVALAVMAGLVSGAMAFAGFSLGAGFAKGFPAWCPRLAGPLLILVACILLLS
jgi:putative Mn2+ efflux pump MntP